MRISRTFARSRVTRLSGWVLLAIATLIAAGSAFVYFGVYDIAATEQHTTPVYWLMQATMRRSVAVRSSVHPLPDLSSPGMVSTGLRLYAAQCVRCHGAPGVAPDAFALGMTPAPANLAETARAWPANDVYWVVKYGIKMTGMPAWQYRVSEDEIQSVVAFVTRQLPYLSPAEYANLAREPEHQSTRATAAALSGPQSHEVSGNPAEGRHAMQQFACGTCHDIPGVTGAKKHVGPPLSGIASRTYIGGVLINTRENMVKWLMSPHRIDPLSAMPDLGVSENDARNMAAYLETLR